jgi:hypothetical protein
MSCSVKRTAILLGAGELRRELHQAVARARRHAGGRLVHQQEPRACRRAPARARPLRVAVGERRATLVREFGHPHALEQRFGFHAIAVRPRARRCRQWAPACASSASCTFSARSSTRTWRRPGTCVHSHPCDRLRRQSIDTRARQRDRARIGRELAVDEVEARRLAGAVRPISATSSPAATSNETSRTASTPPKDFDSPSTLSTCVIHALIQQLGIGCDGLTPKPRQNGGRSRRLARLPRCLRAHRRTRSAHLKARPDRSSAWMRH